MAIIEFTGVDANRSKLAIDSKDITEVFEGPIQGTVIVCGDKTFTVMEDYETVMAEWK
jgi:hypothetical protein